jgi:tRNA pseudouridine65 synthase
MNKIKILFQEKNFLAVDKEAGISVHNNEDPHNLLLQLEKQLGVNKFFPVHRLDKETSGIQVLALNSEVARKLADEFQQRSVEKIYVGVLRGQLKVREGAWALSLSDKGEGRKNPAGLSKDRIPCETRFKVMKDTKFFSMCEFNLITGRQHQIRKHSAMDNHALVGDPRYGDPKYNTKIASIYKTDRMYLHCSRIQILGQTIECPAPLDFEKLFTL